MSFEDNLKKLNINLPSAANPVGSYVATKITSKYLFISGQISIDKNGDLIKGKIGKDLSTDEGYKAAERCAINIIALAKKACDYNLYKIKDHPCTIIQGRHDVICPPESALKLVRKFNKAKIKIVEDGCHSAFEESMYNEIISALKEIY